MTFSIHHITRANIGLLVCIDPDVFDHEIDSGCMAAYAAAPLHAMFVAVAGDVVVGQIRGCVHLQPARAPDLYIDNLSRAPSHQRHGIASVLMMKMLVWGREHGCTYSWVATEMDNNGARGFYTAHTFKCDTIAMFALQMD